MMQRVPISQRAVFLAENRDSRVVSLIGLAQEEGSEKERLLLDPAHK